MAVGRPRAGHLDEQANLFIKGQGEVVEAIYMVEELETVVFDLEFRELYPAVLGSIVWKPMAVCAELFETPMDSASS